MRYTVIAFLCFVFAVPAFAEPCGPDDGLANPLTPLGDVVDPLVYRMPDGFPIYQSNIDAARESGVSPEQYVSGFTTPTTVIEDTVGLFTGVGGLVKFLAGLSGKLGGSGLRAGAGLRAGTAAGSWTESARWSLTQLRHNAGAAFQVGKQSVKQTLQSIHFFPKAVRGAIQKLLTHSTDPKFVNRAKAKLLELESETMNKIKQLEAKSPRSRREDALLEQYYDDLHHTTAQIDILIESGRIETGLFTVTLKNGKVVNVPVTSAHPTRIDVADMNKAFEAVDLDPALIQKVDFFHVHPQPRPLSTMDLDSAIHLSVGSNVPVTTHAIVKAGDEVFVFKADVTNALDPLIDDLAGMFEP